VSTVCGEIKHVPHDKYKLILASPSLRCVCIQYCLLNSTKPDVQRRNSQSAGLVIFHARDNIARALTRHVFPVSNGACLSHWLISDWSDRVTWLITSRWKQRGRANWARATREHIQSGFYPQSLSFPVSTKQTTKSRDLSQKGKHAVVNERLTGVLIFLSWATKLSGGFRGGGEPAPPPPFGRRSDAFPGPLTDLGGLLLKG